MSDLVVVVFKDQYRASEVLNELRRREWNWVIDLDQAVVLRIDEQGKLRVLMNVDPTMQVTPDNPVITDPHATPAWSGELEPELKTDLEWQELFDHSGGEAFQMLFRGNGYVAVQPSEDPGKFKWKPGDKIKSLIGL